MAESGVDLGYDVLLAEEMVIDDGNTQFYQIQSKPISGSRWVSQDLLLLFVPMDALTIMIL